MLLESPVDAGEGSLTCTDYLGQPAWLLPLPDPAHIRVGSMLVGSHEMNNSANDLINFTQLHTFLSMSSVMQAYNWDIGSIANFPHTL